MFSQVQLSLEPRGIKFLVQIEMAPQIPQMNQLERLKTSI
jgi:hypothetical protein